MPNLKFEISMDFNLCYAFVYLLFVPGNYPAKVLLKDVKFWKQSRGCRVKENYVFVM